MQGNEGTTVNLWWSAVSHVAPHLASTWSCLGKYVLLYMRVISLHHYVQICGSEGFYWQGHLHTCWAHNNKGYACASSCMIMPQKNFRLLCIVSHMRSVPCRFLAWGGKVGGWYVVRSYATEEMQAQSKQKERKTVTTVGLGEAGKNCA